MHHDTHDSAGTSYKNRHRDNVHAKRKLLVVIPYFPPNAGGGAEKYAYNISRRLVRDHGWEVVVVTSTASKEPPVTARTNGLKIYRLPYDIKLSNSPLSVRWFWKIKKIIDSENPDLVNVHAPVPGIGDIASATLGDRPLVVTYHMGTMKKQKSYLNSVIRVYENIFLKRMLSKAVRIICSSDFVRDDFLVKYRYKSETVTPAVDSSMFHPAKSAPKRKNILFVGALSRGDHHKGLNQLLRSVSELKKDYPDIRLTIVGGGDGLAQYKVQALDLDILDNVTFTGRLEGKPLADAFRKATVYAHPSTNDSFPLVITEAMASGLPVVSTLVGGIPTLVENGTDGLLVQPRDEAAFTKALKRILTSPGLSKRLGEAARQKAVTELNWSDKSKNTDSIFREALGEAPHEKKFNVAQVSAYFHQNYGHIAEYIKLVAAHLKASETHDAFIVTRHRWSRRFRVTAVDGITVYKLPAFFLFPFGLISPFRSRRIKRIFENERPDIVQLHIPSPNMASATMRTAKYLPVVLTYHAKNMMERKFMAGTGVRIYERLFLEHLFKSAAAVLIASPQILHKSLQKYRYKTHVVMPRIKPSIFGLRNHKKKKRSAHEPGDSNSAQNITISGLSNAGKDHIWQLHLEHNRSLLDDVLLHPLNIIQLAAYYPPHLGGVEVVMQELSTELAQRGNRVQILTSNIGAKRAPGQEQGANFKVDRLNAFEVAHTPLVPALFWQLWRVKRPALFHLHLSQVYLPEIMWIVAKLRGIPYVVHYHLDVPRTSRVIGYLFLMYKQIFWPIVMRGAAHVIVLSPEQGEMVRSRYGLADNQVTYIPNGVSQKFLKIGEKNRSFHKPLRLFYLGRLDKQKHFDRMIEAMALIKSNVKLDIVGDGEERAKLENLTDQLELKNVTFHGPKLGDDRLQYYKQADVFVLPSDKEGMPLVMFEAMAAGLPVIGSDVQGIREHLRGVGVLVSDPSPVTFAAAIDEFYENRAKLYPELSKKAKDKASQYSWELLTDKIETIYRRLAIPKPIPQKIGWKLFAGISVWWLAFISFRVNPSVPELVTNAIGFSFLTLVPGWLTLKCLRMPGLPYIGRVILSIGISVLELMLVGLFSNTVLQLFGVGRPLDAAYLFSVISLFLIALCWAVRKYGEKSHETALFKLSQLLQPGPDRFFLFAPLLFVLMSVMGTLKLNNGGNGNITLLMLVLMAVFSLMLAAKSSKLKDSTMVSAIFSMSLALLLMTSLRGWYTTGHDIQVEFRVFELAKFNGVWKIQNFRQPYNACLSITILPTMFSNMLKTLDPYVFKVYFQILFAVCPVAVYLLARNWLSKALAFIATLYFISFPTFFTDMPFLNRQELAFLFLSLMMYVMFQDSVGMFKRRVVFLLMGTGVILSHYSTTYSVILILGIAFCVWVPVLKAGNYLKRWRIFSNSSLEILHKTGRGTKRFTLTMIVGLALGSFIWTSVLTQTGNNTVLVVKETFGALRAGINGSKLKSNDTNYSLSSFTSTSPKKELNAYVAQQVTPIRKKYPDIFYQPSTYQAYTVKTVSDDTLPLTSLGKFLSKNGLNVASFNVSFRQISAKILQVLVLSGFIYILFRRTYSKLFSNDFLALALGSAVFVALQVFLPVLSVEYGLLRAFQQSLMVLGILTVLGSIAIFAWVPNKKLKIGIAVLLAVLFFISNTGIITQTLGGYYAQLNLNNSGQYYDIYYTHKQEIAGIQWLGTVAGSTHNGVFAQNSPIQADQYTFYKLTTYTDLTSEGDIYPGQIIKNAYVFLGYANVQDKRATVSYNGDLVTYTYPVQFLDSQKDLVYANGGAEVYR